MRERNSRLIHVGTAEVVGSHERDIIYRIQVRGAEDTVSLEPTDAFREVMSEHLVQVSLGEREASIHTDPSLGWLWMLYTTPDGRDISRIRFADSCEYASEYICGVGYIAGHMPDKAEEVEIEGTEMATSATGRGMWITVICMLQKALG